MKRGDDFEPKLGKIRARGGKAGKRTVNRVLHAAALAGAHARGRSAKRSKFTGERIGRGAAVGRVLGQRDRWKAFRTRRVVIKTRLVRLAGRGADGARLHLRYIQRDGVTREGQPGELYNAEHDHADGKAFLERSAGDRHQFRFIVAAEDATEYPDLKPFVRRLMHQMEVDLGTQLEWVAVDHFNTGHPHTHVVLRGKDEAGKDLIIAREYIAHGMRERAAEIATLDLGPRADIEIEKLLRAEVEQERLTSIDRSLLRERNELGLVPTALVARDAHGRFRQALRAGRLQKLGRLSLATEATPGIWHLEDDLEPTLRRMGERGDIIKAMHQALTREGIVRGASDLSIYDPSTPSAPKIVGRVVERGLSDELNDRHYLIVDGVDGRMHYVDIGQGDATEPIPMGAVVSISPKEVHLRKSDRVITEIAEKNSGTYSIEAHLRHDSTATVEFVEAHVRRLEALRRTEVVERRHDGTWIIPADYSEKAHAHEARQAKSVPVTIGVLCPLPIEQQTTADAATWLDQQLIASSPESIRESGFGVATRNAYRQRQQWLIEQGLASDQGGQVVVRPNLIATLRRRELIRVASQLSEELDHSFVDAVESDRVEGVYRRRLDLVSGRFALLQRNREFTLVPWAPALERYVGRRVVGIGTGEHISWRHGRNRGIANL